MFKEDLAEYNDLKQQEIKKLDEITHKVKENVGEILKNHDFNNVTITVEISSIESTITIYISQNELSTNIITEIIKAMGSEKGYTAIEGDKFKFSFKY
jgi:hypothetical protein